MNVRAYTDADLDALRAMHAAQGFAYAFPDLADPLFLVRQVVEDAGRPRMAALLRLTAEAYLLADPAEIDSLLRRGAEKASTMAHPIVTEVKRIVGFVS